MTKHLGDQDIEQIVRIIGGIPRTDWNTLLAEVEQRLGRRYTHQSLRRHTRIVAAFDDGKERDRRGGGEVELRARAVEGRMLLACLRRIESENERLKRGDACHRTRH